MYRVSVLYGTPTDPAEFRRYYDETHIPLAREMKGLTGWTVTYIDDSQGDRFPGVFCIANLYAEDADAMQAILASPEGQAAASDLVNFASGGVQFLFGDEQDVLG